jgi:hypothetical protein
MIAASQLCWYKMIEKKNSNIKRILGIPKINHVLKLKNAAELQRHTYVCLGIR